MKKTYKIAIIAAAALIIVILAVVCVRALMPSKVKAVVQLEAGSEMLYLEEFLIGEDEALIDAGGKASFVTDVSALNLNSVGDKPVVIQIGDKTYRSVLRIVDTVPPTGSPVDQITAKGQKLEAGVFVTDIIDATSVKVYYKTQPDFSKAGWQIITAALEDEGGNKTEVAAKLYILDLKQSVTVEAGSSLSSVTVLDFINDFTDGGDISVSFEEPITKFDSKKAGAYDVVIRANGVLLTSQLIISDTTPPAAVSASKEIWFGETAEASDMVTDIADASSVKCYFKEEPDYDKIGAQTVCVVLEDAYGNRFEVLAELTIKLDKDPPVIKGTRDQWIIVGDNISYKRNVTAEDNKDGEVDVTVDSSAVNIYELGSYPVVYSASDSSGNKATKNITVYVIELDPETVYALADDILAQITTPDMSLLEKARSIHTWVRRNITYTSSADKGNALKGAYYGFTTRQGDCFTYYSVAEALLTRAGIDNIGVRRVGGITQHFWSIINIGGGWYHFDTCPVRISINTFMFTDADAEDYTKRITYLPNYYVYDKSLYPEVVQE